MSGETREKLHDLRAHPTRLVHEAAPGTGAEWNATTPEIDLRQASVCLSRCHVLAPEGLLWPTSEANGKKGLDFQKRL